MWDYHEHTCPVMWLAAVSGSDPSDWESCVMGRGQPVFGGLSTAGMCLPAEEEAGLQRPTWWYVFSHQLLPNRMESDTCYLSELVTVQVCLPAADQYFNKKTVKPGGKWLIQISQSDLRTRWRRFMLYFIWACFLLFWACSVWPVAEWVNWSVRLFSTDKTCDVRWV